MGERRGALTGRVLEQRSWGDSPLFLLDVGCSGGIESRWRPFGNRLRAVGFDPLIAEVDRLNAANTHPGIRYEAAFVTSRDYDQLFPPELRNDAVASRNNQPFERSSAAAALRRMPVSFIQQVFNAGAPVALTDRTITLDEYVPAEEHSRVDFVKIDTDGHDIEVILGAQKILSAGGVIGLTIEAQFHGATHEYANLFSNIDRIVRQQGFSLFDLQSHRYSRAELPAPFVNDMPAQTMSGQMFWGEALYFRDLAAKEYERMWPYEITAERVMKLACLFELFELPDCAAELLLNRADFIDAETREGLLDLLVSGAPGSYRAYVAAFDEDYTQFYPSRIADSPVLSSGERSIEQQPQERLAKLTDKNTRLRAKLQIQANRLDWMAKRVEELKAKRTRKASG
jgi:FkbM family methyltransferase